MTREAEAHDSSSTVRDVYGFTVHPAYTSLFRQFAPAWAIEEADRSVRWDRWLKSLRKEYVASSQRHEHVAENNGVDDAEGLLARALSHYTALGSGSCSLSPTSASLLQQLRSLVQMGVPMNRRATFWKLFLNIEAKRRDGEYDTLVTMALGVSTASARAQSYLPLPGGSSTAEEMHEWLSQIDKDLHRTFPDHPAMNSKGRAMLRRLLAAYAYRNPSVGYCQGLNFIAAAFLLFLPEEEAFWCLAAVVEDLMVGYFDTWMVAPQVDQLAFAHLLKGSAPKVSTHLDSLQVDAPSATSVWFLVAFLNSLPTETCWRVWDVLFFERSPVVLFRVALALMDIYSQALLETQESSDAYMLLQALGPMSFDASRLIDTACIGFGHVKDVALRVLRDKYAAQVADLARGIDGCDEEALASFSTLSSLTPLSRSQSLAETLTKMAAATTGSLPGSPSHSYSDCVHHTSTIGTPESRRSSYSPRSPLVNETTPHRGGVGGGGVKKIPPVPPQAMAFSRTGQNMTLEEERAVVDAEEEHKDLPECPKEKERDHTRPSQTPSKNLEEDLDVALDCRSPLPPPSWRRMTQGHRNGRGTNLDVALAARRTRSAAPIRSSNISYHRQEYFQQQQRIDLHMISAFVPDLDQPAVAAAYRIAANPSPKGKSRGWGRSRAISIDDERRLSGRGGTGGDDLIEEGYVRTPLSVILPRLVQKVVDGGGGRGGHRSGDPEARDPDPDPDEETEGGWTIDVGSLAQAMKSLRFVEDDDGCQYQLQNNNNVAAGHHIGPPSPSTSKEDFISRRFTDGGALLAASGAADLHWRGRGGGGGKGVDLDRWLPAIHAEKMQVPEESNLDQANSASPVQSPQPPTAAAMSPSSSAKSARQCAKAAQLERLLQGLREEVAEGQRRVAQAQSCARDVEDTVAALQGQLTKLQAEVDHKMDILHVIMGRVSQVDGALAERERSRGEKRGAIRTLVGRRRQLQRDVTSKTAAVRALMNAMMEISSTPPGSPKKSGHGRVLPRGRGRVS